MSEVIKRVSAGGKELAPRPVTEESAVSQIVMSLTWDMGASITGIGCDQWFGVWAQADDGTFSTFVQCDRLEHGFAATWKAFADRPTPPLSPPSPVPPSEG